MKTLLRSVLPVLLILLLAGCTTPASRRQDLTTKYPDWDQETLRLVSLGVVKEGMTREQAREAIKVPQRYYVEMENDRWSYVDDIIPDRGALQEHGKVLLFAADRVVRIRNFLRIRDYLIYLEW